ncbi:MAG: aminoacetone oxidase family FAD-binding enzyme [Vicinamibacterales bacterium]
MRGPIVVVGAGAAGLVAAVTAAGAAPGVPVVVVETTADGGRKILISGGGRCNILPAALEPERFVTDSAPRILRGLLRSWPLAGQRAFFEDEVGVPLALEAETAKLFPASDRARDVRDGLVALARRRGVTFRFGTSLTGLAPGEGGWRLSTTAGDLDAAAVVLATGGLSVPATGSDGVGLGLAGALGLDVRPPYPALTPLVAAGAPHAHLSGVSLVARLRARWAGRPVETRGGFLFTHRGYSGPAVLDISHVAVRSRLAGAPAPIRAQWCGLDAEAWHAELAGANGLVATLLARHLPLRLAETLMDEASVPADRRASALRRAERAALVERLTNYQLPWTGDEGYRKAEVTGGGVALEAVDAATLESRRHPGLHLCGEILDAFGPIGGHNFAWAWATGRLAGRGAAGRGPRA